MVGTFRSGHKFFGSPIPLGIFLIREEYKQPFTKEYIQYIQTPNVTIPCSRSALNTLIFWWMITTTRQEEWRRQAITLLRNADYLYQQFQKRHYPAWLNPCSNIVYFKAPSPDFSRHWTLALCNCPKLGQLAHIVVMQHVTLKKIDEFLRAWDSEMKQEGVRSHRRGKISPRDSVTCRFLVEQWQDRNGQ